MLDSGVSSQPQQASHEVRLLLGVYVDGPRQLGEDILGDGLGFAAVWHYPLAAAADLVRVTPVQKMQPVTSPCPA